MTTGVRSKFYGLVLLQLLVMTGLFGYKGITLLTGEPIRLDTVPAGTR